MGPLSSGDAQVRRGGTKRKRNIAEEQLRAFALTTYTALIEKEKEDFPSPHQSSLELMCRLDIGVMMNSQTGRLDYFVNEVERGCLVCLFSSIGEGNYLPHRAADEMFEGVVRLLDRIYSP